MTDKIFTNLHVHSQFSLGDSIARCEDIVKRAKELGMNSISITDHGTLAGWLMFKEACDKYGIKGIFGMEAYFVDDQKSVFVANAKLDELREEAKILNKSKDAKSKSNLSKLETKVEEATIIRDKMRKYNHLILLAKNWEGCLALIRMHNAAVIDGTYYKPRLDWSVLEKYVTKGDVIALSACLGGRIAKLIDGQDTLGAVENINRFNSIFGKGNYFLELQLNDINLQKTVNVELIKLSESTGTPLVVTCDSHYVEEGGHETRALIRQLGQEDYSMNDDMLVDLYIKNEDMLFKSWQKYMPDVELKYLAEAIKNTRQISSMITNFPFDTSLKFPTFETNNDDNQEDFLTKNALKGLINKGLHTKPEYISRLKRELKTITKLGFASYFNVVGDLVGTARQKQAVGPGRGSASGSLVAYCLGITNVNPIEFDLYFERFLDESKGIMMPTFGLEIAKMSLNEEEILKACECHHK